VHHDSSRSCGSHSGRVNRERHSDTAQRQSEPQAAWRSRSRLRSELGSTTSNGGVEVVDDSRESRDACVARRTERLLRITKSSSSERRRLEEVTINCGSPFWVRGSAVQLCRRRSTASRGRRKRWRTGSSWQHCGTAAISQRWPTPRPGLGGDRVRRHA
jgi:hypothetical protein